MHSHVETLQRVSSRARLVPGLHIKGLSNKSPDRCRRRGFTVLPPTGGIINSLPLKGKRLTTFCASLTLLQNVFAVHRKAAIHNPRAMGPSNLRTLRTLGFAGAVNLFPHNPSTQSAAEPRPFFIKLAAKPPPQPSGQRPVKLKNPPALGPVNLKNLFLGTLRTQDAKCPSFTISPLTWPPEACILLSN